MINILKSKGTPGWVAYHGAARSWAFAILVDLTVTSTSFLKVILSSHLQRLSLQFFPLLDKASLSVIDTYEQT